MVLQSKKKITESAMKKEKATGITLPDMVVLSLLSEEPMHGYQLVSELEKRDVQDWAEISRPQVYYSINKLFAKKLISEKRDTAASLGPERTKFEINSKGSEALNEGLSRGDWATQRPPPPFLTWMALSAHLPKSSKKKIVIGRRDFLNSQLQREKKTLAEFDGTSDAMQIAGKLMVEFTIRAFKLELAWLDQVEQKFLVE